MRPLEIVGRLIVCTVGWGGRGGWGCRRGGEQGDLSPGLVHLATRPQTSYVSVAVQNLVAEIRQSSSIAAGWGVYCVVVMAKSLRLNETNPARHHEGVVEGAWRALVSCFTSINRQFLRRVFQARHGRMVRLGSDWLRLLPPKWG
jgi:hypothetical protein